MHLYNFRMSVTTEFALDALGVSVPQYVKKIQNKRLFKMNDAQKVLECLINDEKKTRDHCCSIVINEKSKRTFRDLLNRSFTKLKNGQLSFVNNEVEVFSGHLPVKRKRIQVEYESDMYTTLESSFIATDLDESFVESRKKQVERENEELRVQLKRAQVEMNIAKSRYKQYQF